MKSAEQLGQEYCQEVAGAIRKERWVDFANSGKFWRVCGGSVSRVHPYVLMSWTKATVWVISRTFDSWNWAFWIHSSFSDNHQKLLQCPHVCLLCQRHQPSMVLLSDYLEHQSDDPRQKTLCPCPSFDRHPISITLLHTPLRSKPSSVRFIDDWRRRNLQAKANLTAALWRKSWRISGRCHWDWWWCSSDLDAPSSLLHGCIVTPTPAGLVISTAGYLHFETFRNWSWKIGSISLNQVVANSRESIAWLSGGYFESR